MFGLESILSPLSVDEFLDNHYERSACHIKGSPEKFDYLFGWDDLNSIINDRFAVHSNVKLVLQKQTLPPESLERIDHWLREGATLVINHVHTLDPVLKRFVDILGRDMNFPLWINAYISWPNKQGFDVHFDTHDVFIIHTTGAKRLRTGADGSS